jgi:outer membrane protein assembly factor BamE
MLMNSAFYRVLRAGAPPLFLLLPAALLSACKSVDMPKVPGITPYRMVIQQGNFISQEMVEQLKPGMTKEQVRFVLGTPLVTDIFHADRWDYVFYREMPNGKKEQRNLSVVFEKDRLSRVIGDLMPPEGAPQAGGFKPQVQPPKPAPDTAKPAAAPEKPPAEAAALKPNQPARPLAEVPPPSPDEAPKPAAEAPRPGDSWAPTTQNWGSAPPEPEKPAPVAEEKKAETTAEGEKPKEERGFFGRMLEKIGL